MNFSSSKVNRLQANAGITLWCNRRYWYKFIKPKNYVITNLYVNRIKQRRSKLKSIKVSSSPLLGIFVRWLLDHIGYQMWCHLVDLPNTAFYLLISFLFVTFDAFLLLLLVFFSVFCWLMVAKTEIEIIINKFIDQCFVFFFLF